MRLLNANGKLQQSGSTDCGLFAIAYITSIAFDVDPAQYVFNQTAMQPHLQKCFEEKITFPSFERDDHLAQCALKYTAIVDALTQMVICDGQCGEWFHTKYVNRAV